MNTAIIVLIIFFILIILGVIGYFVYKYYTKPKLPCPENDISNYNISDTPLKASELLQRIFTRVSIVINRIREKFALSPGTVTSISSLVPGVQYTKGTLKSGVSNTVTTSKNGGVNCSPFPSTIYTQINPFNLVSNYRDWYPYGSTASFYKSSIGITNLQSAIVYAVNNGYTAFSFNENPAVSSDPAVNDLNSRILFFKERDIMSTFWTNGSSVSGFKVYADINSKLNSSTLNSFTTVYSKGSYGAVDLGAAETNRLFSMSNIFRRECNGCVGPYTDIYYKRLTPIPSTLSIYSLFNEWRSTNNIINVDFKLYSSLSDLLNDRNSWVTCNYDDPGIGFPRDCGVTTSTIIGGQWNSLTRGGQANVRYSVLN